MKHQLYLLLFFFSCPGETLEPLFDKASTHDIGLDITELLEDETVFPDQEDNSEDTFLEIGLETPETDSDVCTIYYKDEDEDGFGTKDFKCLVKPEKPFVAENSDDCDDLDSQIFPNAQEICNKEDDDCNGIVDDNPIDCQNWYVDVDGDGYGSVLLSQCLCGPSAPYTVSSGGDCNDADGGINPKAVEICNGIDDNCDGNTDEGQAIGCKMYYKDQDGDSYGDINQGSCLCNPSKDFPTGNHDDCNDNAFTIHPNAEEVCNGVDDNCDGLVDEGLGVLNCGIGACQVWIPACVGGKKQVCVPKEPSNEICNQIDDDCDGLTDEEGGDIYYLDADEDTYGNPMIAKDFCYPDKEWVKDNTDCDDSNPDIHPGATEICNEKDDDCDEAIDETAQNAYYFDADQDGFGDPDSEVMGCFPPSPKYVQNAFDCNDLDPVVNPLAKEVCNNIDDNCDGVTDDVDDDQDGEYSVKCGGTDCDDSNPNVNSKATERCNNYDDDCDGLIDESDPEIDFLNDPMHCGKCGYACDEAKGPICFKGECISLPVFQHTWKQETQVQFSEKWKDISGSKAKIKTWGGPLEIELSIPMSGGNNSACRPMIDGKWAGKFQGLVDAYQWHEGISKTGISNAKLNRMWKRTRVYYDIPSGEHEVHVQCITDQGTVSVGGGGSTSLWIVREFHQPNKVYQSISLVGTTIGYSSDMVEVPQSTLEVVLSGNPIEVTISLPIGNGGHAACLEFMDNLPIPTTPPYKAEFWYAGLEATYSSFIMWHHTRIYTGIKPGKHVFSIRCHNNGGTLNIGYQDVASVLIVKEIDETRYQSSQVIDANGNGWEIQSGQANKWYPLPNYKMTFEVKRGDIEITTHLDHYNIQSNQWVTCRPLIDGEWAGSYAGLGFSQYNEEGSQKEVNAYGAWYGMWHRRRVYSNIPLGTHTITVECLSSGSYYSVGNYGNGSLLVREVDLLGVK